MLFSVMVWFATNDSGSFFKAKAETLVHAAHHTQFPSDRLQSFIVGFSQSDGPWGEPPLTEDSGPLRRTTSPENYSSIQSINQMDHRMTHALWQRLSKNIDETAVLVEATEGSLIQQPSPLKPVVFTLRQSRGGRTVRPESVVELNETDQEKETGPGTPSMVITEQCSWQCGANFKEVLHSPR